MFFPGYYNVRLRAQVGLNQCARMIERTHAIIIKLALIPSPDEAGEDGAGEDGAGEDAPVIP